MAEMLQYLRYKVNLLSYNIDSAEITAKHLSLMNITEEVVKKESEIKVYVVVELRT